MSIPAPAPGNPFIPMFPPATTDARAGRVSVATVAPVVGAGHCDRMPRTSSPAVTPPANVPVPARSQCPASIQAVRFSSRSCHRVPQTTAGYAPHAPRFLLPLTVTETNGRDIVVPGERAPLMQRASEPQVIADLLDNLIPAIRRKLIADGYLDPEDHAIIQALSDCSARSLQHAEAVDLSSSLLRVGLTKRNARRLRDLSKAIAA